MDRVGELAGRALRALLPPEKRAEYAICSAWASAAGPQISGRTRPLRAQGGRLVVATDSAAWAAELGYMSEELKERLNAALGSEIVKEIRFVAKPAKDRADGA